jgi:polyphosphate kinase 2 (PPK2 family)
MPKNEHFLLIDDYEDKPEGFNTIVRELARAAADRQTKFEMDIEDEYAEDIEDRIELEDIIEEQKKQLSQQNEQLSQQKEQLSQQNEQLSQQNNMIVVLIKSMLAEGKTIESISKTLNISIDQITELIS